MRIQSRMMIWLLVVCIARPVMANNSAKAKMIYKDAHATLENRVEDLLSRMTLKEKVLQLNQYTLGTNNIENNKGVEVKNIPAEIQGGRIKMRSPPKVLTGNFRPSQLSFFLS